MPSRYTLRRRTLLAGVGGLALSAPAVHAQGRTAGVALVIGNSKYQWEAQLPNVKRDVPDIAKRFEACGLKTVLLQDVGQDAMRRAVEQFALAAKDQPLAMFYFAGHGVFQKNSTSLVPVDGDLSTPDNLKTMTQTFHFRRAMDFANHRVLILDNCRNNPSDGWRQREAVDAAMGISAQAIGPKQPVNTKLIFSTAPGRAALDGPAGENSPFAAALLRQFAGGSIDMQAMPANLRRDLMIATEGRQVMLDMGELEAPLLISGKSAAAPRNPGSPANVLELTNAYALAQQQGLPMLPGLVAYRTPGHPAGGKVGGYSVSVGGSKAVLAVLSVDDQQGAEAILVSKPKSRGVWRLIHGRLSGETLEFNSFDGGPRWAFRWNTPNGGSATGYPPQNQGGNSGQILNGTFTRIDG
jgi:hypothetical protein